MKNSLEGFFLVNEKDELKSRNLGICQEEGKKREEETEIKIREKKRARKLLSQGP